MDPLTQQLVQRAVANPTLPDQTSSAVLPNPTPKVPQKVKRFQNAQAIQDAYRSGWTPNPILLRAQLGHR